jgi:hypothetical protein
MRAPWLALVLAIGLAACGSVTAEDDLDGGSGLRLGDGGTQLDTLPPITPANAHVRGIVYAPNGLNFNPPLTVSGALVYVSDFPPEPVPSTIVCERCTDVPSGATWALTDANGAFDLNIWDGSYILVIQKGQFRLVRSIIVGPDQTLDMPETDTMLPSRNSSDGNETIPKIALLSGSFDKLEDLFAKLGFATVDSAGTGIQWDNNVQFDVYANGGDMPPSGNPANKGTALDLLSNYELMKTYHIIFVPCSSTNSSVVENAAVQENLQKYVREGGKFYVADWSYDYLRQTWDLVHFDGDDGATVGSANSASFSYAPYDSGGHAVNEDLYKWLEAQSPGWGGDSLVLKENWDWVTNLTEGYMGDVEGSPLYAKPDVFVEGPREDGASWKSTPSSAIYPLTLGFPYGCGRVFYTTYHTVGEMSSGHSGLEIQERILVYLIMEIGACQSGPILE